MATATITATATSQKRTVELAPESERFLRCCADLANALIEDHEATKNGRPGRDINLNSLRAKLAKKHKLANIPPLTAIIAAIPEHYKKYILPKLIAKPIRKIEMLPRMCGDIKLIRRQEHRPVLLLLLSCANRIDAHTLPTLATFAFTAQEDPIRISNTAHSPIPDTSPLQ